MLNSMTNSIHLSIQKIYLLRRDYDERMVTVDDDRMRCYFDQIDSQDHDITYIG